MKLRNLTALSVTIADGDHCRAFVNSPAGRTLLSDWCPPGLLEAVLAVWGDKPILKDPVEELQPEPGTGEAELLRRDLEALADENRVLRGKLAAQEENAAILEECLVELAGVVYA